MDFGGIMILNKVSRHFPTYIIMKQNYIVFNKVDIYIYIYIYMNIVEDRRHHFNHILPSTISLKYPTDL